MFVSALSFIVLYLGFSKLHDAQGESISNGKKAKQSSTYSASVASHALDRSHLYFGSITDLDTVCWWELDLRGYFTISNITLSARTGQPSYMEESSMEVMDKDVSLCSDAQVVRCGTVPTSVAPGETFTFTCNATFPVRFVRVTRSTDTGTIRLSVGHIDVQGEWTNKPYRSYYKPSWNKKVSEPFLTTSVLTAGDCGIVCHKHHSCIDFSYSEMAPTDENCLLTDKALSSHYINDSYWTTYTIYSMLCRQYVNSSW